MTTASRRGRIRPPPRAAHRFDAQLRGWLRGQVAGAVWQRTNPFLGCNDYTNPDPAVCSTRYLVLDPRQRVQLERQDFLGGGQVGYNFAFGKVVLGVEADIAYTSIDTTSTFHQPFPCCVRDVRSCTGSCRSLSTVRGRLGSRLRQRAPLRDRRPGGRARSNIRSRLTDPSLVGRRICRRLELRSWPSDTRGAGIEISFGQWSLRTEYLFYDLGQETLTAPFLIGGAREPFTFRPEFDTQGQIVRIGTNFQLQLMPRE